MLALPPPWVSQTAMLTSAPALSSRDDLDGQELEAKRFRSDLRELADVAELPRVLGRVLGLAIRALHLRVDATNTPLSARELGCDCKYAKKHQDCVCLTWRAAIFQDCLVENKEDATCGSWP